VRYTWAYFTFGAHSTQRAEAIHSALKRILHANMLLTQLVEALIMYSEVKEFKVEMHKTRQALNQAFQGANQHPFVEEVRKSGKVTPHDVQLLRSEAGQVNGYTLEPVPAQPGVDAADHDPQFIVKPVQRVQEPSSGASGWDEDTLRASDYCLSAREPAEGRITTRKRCSCQYHKSVGYDAKSKRSVLRAHMMCPHITSLISYPFANACPMYPGHR